MEIQETLVRYTGTKMIIIYITIDKYKIQETLVRYTGTKIIVILYMIINFINYNWQI